MAAAQYDFDIEQGSSYKLAFVYKDADKNVVDLSNWCVRFIITTSNNQTIQYHSENTDFSEYKLSLDGPNGKVTLLLPADTTNNFDFKSARYDVELVSDDELYSNGGFYTTRILYGVINILKRYSKNPTSMEC
jgi:hypothetical protein